MEHLTCPICGKGGYQNLICHVIKFHKMDIDEYKRLYNYPLYTEECRKSFAKGAVASKATLSEKDFKARAVKARDTKLRKNPNYYSDWSKNLWKSEEYREKKVQGAIKQHKDGLTKLMMDGHKRITVHLSNNKDINVRSTWEMYLCHYLDANGIEFEYEPFFIEYLFNGKVHKYYPDFYIPEINLVIEVKPKCFLGYDVNISKIEAVKSHGYNFRYITEDDISKIRSSLDG